MKKILMIVGALFLIGLIGGGGWLYLMIQEGQELDESSRRYVERNIPKLAKERWYGPHMHPLAHSAFMEAVSMEDWQRISILYWQKLGMLQNFPGCQGQANIMYNEDGKSVTAKYVCPAKFEKAEAVIEVTLQQENEQWKIIHLNVKSPAFLE